MDFGTLLDFAKQNEKPNKEVKCYRTTFGPPKKQPKAKCLSENIQKFLARKEEEEQKKLNRENKKLEELLALRAQDSKANKRVRAMLKSTKAANKAAIDDARDDVNTAVTMAGPSQPDEDDYGYVSQEASAFYNKLMDKYSSTPSMGPNFTKKSQSVKDLTSTKDRVRMALLKEEEEESTGHKRKRRRTKEEMRGGKQEGDDDHGQHEETDRGVPEKEPDRSYTSREKYEPEVKKRKIAAPPPMDFAQLLKVAAQKQFEPIKIEKKDSKNDDEERPMTKKQREEYLREKEYRLRKEERTAAAARAKEKPQPSSSAGQAESSDSRTNSVSKMPSIPRIPKLNGAKAAPESQTRLGGNDNEAQIRKSAPPQQMSSREGNFSKPRLAELGRQNSVKSSSSAREPEMRGGELKKSTPQQSSKYKESYPEKKPLPVQNVPSPKERRISIEEKKPQITQSSKPVIKDDRRQSYQSLKPVIKEEKRLTTNQSSKPVIKEEKRQLNQPPRPVLKEERKLPPPESPRMPPKLGKPVGTPVSKQSQPPQQNSSSSKPVSNLVKKTDDKRNMSVSRIAPVSGSMLKDRLTSSNNQSLPQKSQQGSNQSVKKEVRTEPPPAKSKSAPNIPPARPTLPKEMTNRPPAGRPQAPGSQGPSREGLKGGPPDRRRELPPKGEMRRPPSMYDRGPPGGRGFPPNRPRPMHPQDARKRAPAKRRIESDDEYDSELEDFIDDGPAESEDYSKYIKEIFGYDKSRYNVVEYEDEDECMESNYAQQMKEEFVSTKLGILEDLEDIKKEQMEKMNKKKVIKKKK